MRKEQVPDNMSSEIKEILGVVSKRQVIYILIAGSIAYSYIPFVAGLFSNVWLQIGIAALSVLPTAAVAFFLGFWWVESRQMFLDKYLWTKFRAKTQRGSWYKGSH